MPNSPYRTPPGAPARRSPSSRGWRLSPSMRSNSLSSSSNYDNMFNLARNYRRMNDNSSLSPPMNHASPPLMSLTPSPPMNSASPPRRNRISPPMMSLTSSPLLSLTSSSTPNRYEGIEGNSDISMADELSMYDDESEADPLTIADWLLMEKDISINITPDKKISINIEPAPLLVSNESVQIDNTSNGFDPVGYEHVNVYDYLREDINHVVFVFERKFYPISKEDLQRLCDDCSFIKYECLNGMQTINTTPYLLGKSFNVPCGLIELSKIKTIIETPEIRLVHIVDFDPPQDVDTTASLLAILSILRFNEVNFPRLSPYEQDIIQDFNFVGASHCQAGQDERVRDTKILPTPPEVFLTSGGRKKTIRRKNKRSKKTTRRKRRTRKVIRT
jgi:hypothetical protein